MRMVEQIGSGISRMRDLMKEEGLTPPEFYFDDKFIVTFISIRGLINGLIIYIKNRLLF